MDRHAAASLVYVGDPMCSWCWGFAPTLERLVADHDVALRIVVGGLRPGPAAERLTPQLESFLLHHWERVEAVSGQPFDRQALGARGPAWRYDTENPAVAVVTMRSLRPEAELAFFTRLQRAFYTDGVDIVDPSTYPKLLEGFDVDGAEFVARVRSDEMREAAWADFAEARRLGVTGFPTTLIEIGDRYRMLAAGYQPYERVDELLHAVLERHDPEAATGLVCTVDGGPC